MNTRLTVRQAMATKKKYSPLLVPGLSSLGGLFFLLSLFPFQWPGAGALSLFFLVVVAGFLAEDWPGRKRAAKKDIARLMGGIWLAGLCFTLVPFYWLPGTVARLTLTPDWLAWPLVALTHWFLNPKPVLLLTGLVFLFRWRERPLPRLWGGLFLITLLDLSLPQLFPWYWGNLVGDDFGLLSWASLVGARGMAPLLWWQMVVLNLIIWWVVKIPLRRFGALANLTPSMGLFGFQYPPKTYRRWLVISGSVLLFVYAIGFYQRQVIHERVLDFQPLVVRILQTNTARGRIPEAAPRVIAGRALQELWEVGSRSSGKNSKPDLVLLPEAAVPYHQISDPDKAGYSPTWDAILGALSWQSGAPILYNQVFPAEAGNGEYNEARLFRPDGTHSPPYRKRELVPFGEYLPGWLEKLFPFVSDATWRDFLRNGARYISGKGASVLPVGINPLKMGGDPGDPVTITAGKLQQPDWWRDKLAARGPTPREREWHIAPLICYEGMNPDLARNYFTDRAIPQLLVNLTNDSWFYGSLADWQHADTLRFRALETGRSVVRAALGGPSLAYDPAGNRLLPVGERDRAQSVTIAVPVPSSRQGPRTWYSFWGDTWSWLFSLICGFSLLLSGYHRLKWTRHEPDQPKKE